MLGSWTKLRPLFATITGRGDTFKLNETKDVEFLPQAVHECILWIQVPWEQLPQQWQALPLGPNLPMKEVWRKRQVLLGEGPEKKKKKTTPHTRWCFQTCFIFIPTLWGRLIPFWLSHIFQMGWFNHQLENNFSWIELCQISHLPQKNTKIYIYIHIIYLL